MKTPQKLNLIETTAFKSYLEESRGLERDYLEEVNRSRNMAWTFCCGFLILSILGLIVGVLGLYQEKAPPVVLRVDNSTGAVDVVTTLKEKEITHGEVVDQYWLNQYVLNREKYNNATIQASYDTTALLSAPKIQREYYELFEGPNARDVILGKNSSINVTVLSIQIISPGAANIRFKTQKSDSNGVTHNANHLIASVSYEYIASSMSASDRRFNPLGFQITSYTTAPETLNLN